MADQQKSDDAKPAEKDMTGIWIGVAMCGGTALLMLIGWLGRGSVPL